MSGGADVPPSGMTPVSTLTNDALLYISELLTGVRADRVITYADLLVQLSGAIGGGGGAVTWLGLTDTPNDYTGQAGLFVRVNATENGLEFAAGGGGVTAFVSLSDVNAAALVANGLLRTNGAGDEIEALPAGTQGQLVRVDASGAPNFTGDQATIRGFSSAGVGNNMNTGVVIVPATGAAMPIDVNNSFTQHIGTSLLDSGGEATDPIDGAVRLPGDGQYRVRCDVTLAGQGTNLESLFWGVILVVPANYVAPGNYGVGSSAFAATEFAVSTPIDGGANQPHVINWEGVIDTGADVAGGATDMLLYAVPVDTLGLSGGPNNFTIASMTSAKMLIERVS